MVFGGDTHALIPLYMIGVFVSFTLSQAGHGACTGARLRESRLADERRHQRLRRARHGHRAGHRRDHEGGRRRVDHPAHDPGARRHLRGHAAPLRQRRRGADAARLAARTPPGGHVVLVPIGGMQRAVVQALRYARTLSDDVRAVYVEVDPAATDAVRQAVGRHGGRACELVVLASPYRSLLEPLLEYIEQVQREDPDGYVTVVLPEFVPRAAVAAPAPQPARAAHQGRAALQAERRRDERAVPPRAPRAGPRTEPEHRAGAPPGGGGRPDDLTRLSSDRPCPRPLPGRPFEAW